MFFGHRGVEPALDTSVHGSGGAEEAGRLAGPHPGPLPESELRLFTLTPTLSQRERESMDAGGESQHFLRERESMDAGGESQHFLRERESVDAGGESRHFLTGHLSAIRPSPEPELPPERGRRRSPPTAPRRRAGLPRSPPLSPPAAVGWPSPPCSRHAAKRYPGLPCPAS